MLLLTSAGCLGRSI